MGWLSEAHFQNLEDVVIWYRRGGLWITSSGRCIHLCKYLECYPCFQIHTHIYTYICHINSLQSTYPVSLSIRSLSVCRGLKRMFVADTRAIDGTGLWDHLFVFLLHVGLRGQCCLQPPWTPCCWRESLSWPHWVWWRSCSPREKLVFFGWALF